MSDNQKKLPLVAKIVFIGVIISILLIAIGVITNIEGVILAGMAVFALTIIGGLVESRITFKKNALKTNEVKELVRKYDPLLLDERTKQDPEVQRLLQYTSVQKVFFDPAFLRTAAAQNDPNVRELLGVLDEMILTQTANGDYPQYPNQSGLNGTNAYASELMRKEIERREKEKNKPRRIVGTVLGFVGAGLFVIPFFIVFFLGMNSPESTTLMKSASSFLMASAPFGMMLIVIGSILKK